MMNTEDKSITINNYKINNIPEWFKNNRNLIELKYFNPGRLVFSELKYFHATVAGTNISFFRKYMGAVGPLPRKVAKGIKNVYDVEELFGYDPEDGEFGNKYDFEQLKTGEYHILINAEWFKSNVEKDLQEPTFIYNLNIGNIYKIGEDDDAAEIAMKQTYHNTIVIPTFTMFDATKKYLNNPDILKNIPEEYYTVLITEEWVKANLSSNYLKELEIPKPIWLCSERIYSFGLNRNELDPKKESYQISLCLYRTSPKHSEIVWALKYEELAMQCRKHIQTSSDLRQFKQNAKSTKGITWKLQDLGNGPKGPKGPMNIGDINGPKLYPKIMFFKNTEGNGEESGSTGQFKTIFIDKTVVLNKKTGERSERIIQNPFDVLNKRGIIEATLKVESLYLGSTITSLQTRVKDVEFYEMLDGQIEEERVLKKSKIFNKIKKGLPSPSKQECDNSDFEISDDDLPKQKPKRTTTKVNL